MPDQPAEVRKTREQAWAQGSFQAIEEVAKKHTVNGVIGGTAQDYGRLCLRLPFLIQQSGLCQALAFLEGKSKKEHFHAVLQDFGKVSGATLARARNVSAPEYQRMSAEALRVAVWFKRYAEAVLKVTPGDEDGGER